MTFLMEKSWVSITRGARLFNKNTIGCESVMMSTADDSCPVQVSETLFQRGQGPVNGGRNYDGLKVA